MNLLSLFKPSKPKLVKVSSDDNSNSIILDVNSNAQNMSKGDIKFSHGDENLSLEVSEHLILFNSLGKVSLDFRDIGKIPKRNIFNNWLMEIIFTDDIPADKKPMSFELSFANKQITLFCYSWYGQGIENVEPIHIKPLGSDKTLYRIKIRSTALISSPLRRTLDINIWRII